MHVRKSSNVYNYSEFERLELFRYTKNVKLPCDVAKLTEAVDITSHGFGLPLFLWCNKKQILAWRVSPAAGKGTTEVSDLLRSVLSAFVEPSRSFTGALDAGICWQFQAVQKSLQLSGIRVLLRVCFCHDPLTPHALSHGSEIRYQVTDFCFVQLLPSSGYIFLPRA